MNNLVQIESNLIGSREDILTLEEKKSANILVISDTHGDYDVLCDIIEEFGPVSDALVFCCVGICDICTYLQDAYEDENLQELLQLQKEMVIPKKIKLLNQKLPMKVQLVK